MKDVWQTPPSVYEPLDDVVGIDLDPCAGPNTTVGETNWCVEDGDDGLVREWFGTVFVNPPFSAKDDWIDKCLTEIPNTDLIILLTPDSMDVQSWWHECIVPHADYVWFSDGRVNFIDPETGEKPDSGATFGTALSLFGGGTVPQELLVLLDTKGWLVHDVVVDSM